MPETGYEFINAKIHGMKRAMMEGERLAELIASRDLARVAEAAAPGLEKPRPTYLDIERHLTKEHFAALEKVWRNMQGPGKTFFGQVLRRAEIENLKVVLRCWSRRGEGEEMDADAIRGLLAPSPASADPPISTFMHCETVEEFVREIPAHDVRACVMDALSASEGLPELFAVELGLDLAYFEQVRNAIPPLSAADREAARELIGSEADVCVMLWAWRLSRSYGVAAEQVLTPALRLCRAVTASHLHRMASAASAEERLAAAPRIYQKHLDQECADDLARAEACLYSYLYSAARRRFYLLSDDLSGVLGFYYLKRFELANLIRVVQAVRYGVEVDAAREFLLPAPS